MKKHAFLFYSSLLLVGLCLEPARDVEAEQSIYNPLNPTEAITPTRSKEKPTKVTIETSESIDSESSSEKLAVDQQESAKTAEQQKNQIESPIVPIEKHSEAAKDPFSPITTFHPSQRILLTDAFFQQQEQLNVASLLPKPAGSGTEGAPTSQLIALSYLFSGTVLYGEKATGKGGDTRDVATIFR